MRHVVTVFVASSLWVGLHGAAAAQVVQLPTYRVFGTNTTVSVPDGGQSQLGRVASGRTTTTTRSTPLLGSLPGAGPLFRNRALASRLGYTGSSVRVQVIDLAEMDRAVLAAAERRDARRSDPNLDPAQPAEPERETIVLDPDQLIALGRTAKARGDYRLATAYFNTAAEISRQLSSRRK